MIEIEVHGGAKYTNREMSDKILAITKEVYGITPELTGVDFQSYYRPDGAKITKTLTAILRKQLEKKQVQEGFAAYGRMVSDLYNISKTFNAFFGDKKELGEGVYENSSTCFRKGGENETSKNFLVNFKWARALVLQDKKCSDYRARCICYLGGGRNIYLTNFYWRGIPANYLYFVTAVRRLFGLKKVLYRRNPKFFLPIYRNGDAIHIYDERSKLPHLGKKMPCPHCGKLTYECDMHYEEISSHRLVGCSPRCARLASKVYSGCTNCGNIRFTNEMVHIGDKSGKREYICRKCYKETSICCEICGNSFVKTQMTKVNDMMVCKSCAQHYPTCGSCSERVYRDEMITVGNVSICQKCARTHERYCEVCRSMASVKCTVIKAGGRKIRVCKECLEPAPGTDLGAAT